MHEVFVQIYDPNTDEVLDEIYSPTNDVAEIGQQVVEWASLNGYSYDDLEWEIVRDVWDEYDEPNLN